MAAKIPSAAEYKAQLFDPVFWNAETLRTVDPSEVTIPRSAHPLVPIVSLVGDEPTDNIPPKGLILAPFHVPAYLNAKPDEALTYVLDMAASIRKTIDQASGGEGLKFVIWSGMGGSIEDKYAAVAAGMMGNGNVQFFGLDDINGESLGHVFKQIEAASGGSLVAGLRRTVCVAQALGMTSLEPVFNVQQALLPTFEALGLKPAQHFWKVTIPGSLLDQALQDPVQNVVHQPGGQSTAAGRHDYVSHGILLPLLLANDPEQGVAAARTWARSLDICDADVDVGLALAQWMADGQTLDPPRNKIVLVLPDAWRAGFVSDTESGRVWRDVALWFKQHFEESLGKNPGTLLKIIVNSDLRSAEPDRGYVFVNIEGLEPTTPLLAKFPSGQLPSIFVVNTPAPVDAKLYHPLPRLMQLFTYTKYRVAELLGLTAVNQPPVEFYKKVVAFMRQAPEKFDEVSALINESQFTFSAEGSGFPGISVNFTPLVLAGHSAALGEKPAEANIVELLARVHTYTRKQHPSAYGEFIYFGNLTYGAEAEAMRTELLGAPSALWESTFGSFADVGKGPGVGHATHAMGKQGGVLTASILPRKHLVSHPQVESYPHDYQTQNAYANALALAGFDVVDGALKITGHQGLCFILYLDQNSPSCRASLSKLYAAVAAALSD